MCNNQHTELNHIQIQKLIELSTQKHKRSKKQQNQNQTNRNKIKSQNKRKGEGRREVDIGGGPVNIKK